MTAAGLAAEAKAEAEQLKAARLAGARAPTASRRRRGVAVVPATPRPLRWLPLTQKRDAWAGVGAGRPAATVPQQQPQPQLQMQTQMQTQMQAQTQTQVQMQQPSAPGHLSWVRPVAAVPQQRQRQPQLQPPQQQRGGGYSGNQGHQAAVQAMALPALVRWHDMGGAGRGDGRKKPRSWSPQLLNPDPMLPDTLTRYPQPSPLTHCTNQVSTVY